MAAVLEGLRRRFALAPGAEITVECNPESVSRRRLEGYRRAGVNRISLGVQSLDDRILPRLDRIDVEKVPVGLAHHDERVVSGGEANRFQSRVRVGQPPRHVAVHEAADPLLPPREAGLGFELDQVDFATVREHVLRLEVGALERPAAERA